MTLKNTYASITTTICAASHFNIIVWEYRYTVLLCVFTSLFNLFLLKNFLKGLVYLLSHDCHIDIDRDISTAYCRSSSRVSVDLLSRTICTTMVVSDWCITNLAHCWWVSIQSIVGITRGGNCSLSGPLW